jgi:hypothetical protein
MSVIYVRVGQTMPRSLRFAAAICVYDWCRLTKAATTHTRSVLRRRGAARAREFKTRSKSDAACSSSYPAQRAFVGRWTCQQ